VVEEIAIRGEEVEVEPGLVAEVGGEARTSASGPFRIEQSDVDLIVVVAGVQIEVLGLLAGLVEHRPRGAVGDGQGVAVGQDPEVAAVAGHDGVGVARVDLGRVPDAAMVLVE
jgi:hypothetical protein